MVHNDSQDDFETGCADVQGGVTEGLVTSISLATGTWEHLAVSYDGSTSTLSLAQNGTSISSVVVSTEPSWGAGDEWWSWCSSA